MAEAEPKKPLMRWSLRALAALGIAAALCVGYLFAVLLPRAAIRREDRFVVEAEPVTRMQPATMNQPTALAQVFEAPLPILPGYAATGEADNAQYDGQLARIATLRYDGLTISAVRPAAAAPLIRQNGLSVTGSTVALNQPAVVARNGDSFCLYLTTDDAAYAIFAPEATEEQFESVLTRLTWVW